MCGKGFLGLATHAGDRRAPRTLGALGLLKEDDTSRVGLRRPEGLPQPLENNLLPVTAGTASAIVYVSSEVLVVRRLDTTIEVDRSREFERDGVVIRGKIRAALDSPTRARWSGSTGSPPRFRSPELDREHPRRPLALPPHGMPRPPQVLALEERGRICIWTADFGPTVGLAEAVRVADLDHRAWARGLYRTPEWRAAGPAERARLVAALRAELLEAEESRRKVGRYLVRAMDRPTLERGVAIALVIHPEDRELARWDLANVIGLLALAGTVALEDAGAAVREILTGGEPMELGAFYAEAAHAGLSTRAADRARSAVGVRAWRAINPDGSGGSSCVCLPATEALATVRHTA